MLLMWHLSFIQIINPENDIAVLRVSIRGVRRLRYGTICCPVWNKSR